VLKRLSRHERHRIAQLYKQGLSYRQVMAEVGRSMGAVQRVIEDMGGVIKPTSWAPSPTRLSLAEREEISRGLERGDSYSAIARSLGRDPSTVSREVNANGGRDHYRAWRAHRAAERRARRPKPAKLASCPALRAQVEEWLAEWWSPEQITRRLREEFPDDPMMRVSHETIYQSLFVQGRGALRRELAACLRSGRAVRKPRGRTQRRAKIPDMVMISERPAEVEDRAVPGHWEGDLIIGKGGRSAVGTLVERATRYVLLLHPPGERGATEVREAMAAAIQTLPSELVRSITWDQGTEMAQHRTFSVDTGVAIYFCDPHAPWQRGSNENTNGLLRQYMPKGTDLSVHTAEDLQRFARSLNNRPRETLGWKKPSEKLAEFIAMTG
jgi:transposase, IS30 family